MELGTSLGDIPSIVPEELSTITQVRLIGLMVDMDYLNERTSPRWKTDTRTIRNLCGTGRAEGQHGILTKKGLPMRWGNVLLNWALNLAHIRWAIMTENPQGSVQASMGEP
jgi:hypothetical protein